MGIGEGGEGGMVEWGFGDGDGEEAGPGWVGGLHVEPTARTERPTEAAAIAVAVAVVVIFFWLLFLEEMQRRRLG